MGDLVTGANLVSTTIDNLVSTTLNPPQEQPVTFFPSEEEEEEVTTDNVIVDSDGLASEGLVIASNEIADESVEAESVTELVTSSETKKSSRREGGRAQSVDSQNVIKFVDVKENSNRDETTVKPEENLSNSRIIFPDDADDEENCISGLVCGGRCLATHQVCDSLVDCEDGKDESNCSSFPSCQADNEFSCLKGRCIPQAWNCDGKPDCSEGEDEVACSTSCPVGQMLCGEGRCLEQRFVCDGVNDCGQGEDEANCTCGSEQFQCQWGGGCVANDLRCNGNFDCSDRSDELGCREVEQPECGDWSLSEDHMRWLIKGDRKEDSGIQWPTISLLFNVETTSSCTVSILSPKWLATSHSCLASASLDPTSWVLFGGPAGGDLAVNGTQIKTVEDIVSHPKTRRSQHLQSNALALALLEEPLEFNAETSSICDASEEP